MPLTSTLQEFALAGHFRDALDLTIRDLATWSDLFAPDFPEFRQLPSAPRVELIPVPATIQIGEPGLPRIYMGSPKTGLYVMLQADRFTYGWSRVEPLGEPAAYPGYDVMKTFFKEFIIKFLVWHSTRFGGAVETRLLDISYINAVPNDERTGHRHRLFDIYKFLKDDIRPVNGFHVTWNEALKSGEANSPRVTAQAGLAIIPPNNPVFLFNFSGVTSWDQILSENSDLSAVDELHARILDMRAASITSEFIGS